MASGHPWIFASDVSSRGTAQPGDAVKVADSNGRPLGTAHYSSTSQISLRMLSPRIETVDRQFLRARIEAAAQYRHRVVAGTDSYRLVFGEADFLPGLVVDRYGGAFALQTLSQGMDRMLDDIVQCLTGLFAPDVVVARNTAAARSRESLPLETRVLAGTPAELTSIAMNGLKLAVDIVGGQKTGIFLDQRENYLAAARWARGRALDCFTCTGGFALHLARVCEHVEAVDSSASALRIAGLNRAANEIGNADFREADVFDLLAGHNAAARRFDTIVLDPPAFAKSRAHIDQALRGYNEINQRALKLMNPGGILITCSCSHHVSEAELLGVVAQAALDANRTIRILERRTQALDHPILLTVPETHYLKCLILEVL